VAACLLNVRLALHSANVPIAGGENVVAGGFCRMIINKWAQNNAVVPYQTKMDWVGFEPATSAMPLDRHPRETCYPNSFYTAIFDVHPIQEIAPFQCQVISRTSKYMDGSGSSNGRRGNYCYYYSRISCQELLFI